MNDAKEKNIITEAFEQSVGLLRRLSTEKGFIASVNNTANYKRVWARDGIVAGLAALRTGDKELITTFRHTLETLARHQDHTGRIPSNVTLDEKRVSYGTTVGRVDATIWFVIGVCQYVFETGDDTFFSAHKEVADKALLYLECLELNGRGLLYIPEGGDWADEYINHAYVLFDQVLYYIAMQSMYLLTKKEQLKERSDRLAELIRVNYFPHAEYIESEFVYHKALFEKSIKSYRPPLPLAYFSPHGTNDHITNFANALLLVTDIVKDETKKAITHTVFSQCAKSDFPILPAFYPVIEEGSHNWSHLVNNHLYEFRNKPHHFHNGGLWSLVHGFFLAGAAAYEGDAKEKLRDFADVLARDNFTFPEYYDGLEFLASGTKELGFSAAAYIIAHEAILNCHAPIHLATEGFKCK